MKRKKPIRIKPETWTGEKTMTLLVVAFVVTVLVVYDLLVILMYKDINATISNTVYQASKRTPVIPFIFGVLMGHLFWPITHFKGRERIYLDCSCVCQSCNVSNENHCNENPSKEDKDSSKKSCH